MSWKNKTEEFFKFYANDLAECLGMELTKEQLNDVVNDIMEDDYLFETIDGEIKEIFDSNGIVENEEDEESEDE